MGDIYFIIIHPSECSLFDMYHMLALAAELVGQHPKPFNNFREIGYAPLVLIIILFLVVMFWISTCFRILDKYSLLYH